MQRQVEKSGLLKGSLAILTPFSPFQDDSLGTPSLWRRRTIVRIGRPRRRRSTLGVSFRTARTSSSYRKLTVTDKNPKAFAFANPGRLAKTAARSHDVLICSYNILTRSLRMLMRFADQRKAIPRPSSRSHPRRTPATTRHHCWSTWCRQDNSAEVIGQALCEGNAF